MTELLTKNTDKLRQEVAAHVAADQVVQGAYWTGSRGCFIGCLAHSNDPLITEEKYGLPIMVQRIAEAVFERLPARNAIAFFAAFPDAVECDGKDLSRVGWRFLDAELRNLPPQSGEIQAVIDPVIAGIELLAQNKAWDRAAALAAANAARVAADAARAAADAAVAAADAAAWTAGAAALAADDAAEAAGAAGTAAWAATGAVGDAGATGGAATRRQRDLLLRLIAEAEVHHE